MQDNPFTSDEFSAIWLQHFCTGTKEVSFDFLKGPSFVKHKMPLTFVNVGRSNTKGLSYELCVTALSDYKKKVFLIYDVPGYFNINVTNITKNLKLKKIQQYPGFLIDLKQFISLENYLQKSFSKSSRYKLKKYRKRLEQSFNIRYEMFYGDISPEKHESVFKNFKALLEKRFDEKQITNNNLDTTEWAFFREVSLLMILKKKASLFVIYQEDIPIAITLNFMGDKVLFDAITVFDTNYSKFNLGYVNIMGLVEWCFQNGYNVLDFSKGYFDYKKRWGNLTYDFEYHMLYDGNYLPTVAIANMIAVYFKTKQKLREWKINEFLHKLTYSLRGRKKNRREPVAYQHEEIAALPALNEIEPVPVNSSEYISIKKPLYSFLYLHSEHIDDVSVYAERKGRFFYLQGKKKTQKISLQDT